MLSCRSLWPFLWVVVGTGFGVGTAYADVLSTTNAEFGSQVFAFCGAGDGLNRFEQSGLLDRYSHRRYLERIENLAGAFCVDGIVKQRFSDFGESDLDSSAVFRHGKTHGAELFVRLIAEGTELAVEVTKVFAAKRGRFAAKAVRFDVAASEIHNWALPPPFLGLSDLFSCTCTWNHLRQAVDSKRLTS